MFIGATNFDKKFRAFDKATGAPLWETTLPFSGNGTPATYEVDGRQNVAIAAGAARAARDPMRAVHLAAPTSRLRCGANVYLVNQI